MLKNAELYEAKQKEKEEMRYMELLNDIFNEENYDIIRKNLRR